MMSNVTHLSWMAVNEIRQTWSCRPWPCPEHRAGVVALAKRGLGDHRDYIAHWGRQALLGWKSFLLELASMAVMEGT
jgi:hypothetical protein